MELQKKKDFLIRFLYAAVVLAIAIYICRKAVFVLRPFVVALLVSLLLRPVVHFLQRVCRIQKTIAAVCVVLLFYALVGVLLTLLGFRLVTGVKDIVLGLPEFYNLRVEPLLYQMGGSISSFVERLDPAAASTVSAYLVNAGNAIESTVSSFSMAALKAATGYAFSVPGYLLNILITIIATVFLSSDFPRIKRFLLYQLPEEKQTFLRNVRTHLGRTLGRYVRSYALILFITFTELSLGLALVGIDNPLLLALLIALFDILPVVGSGTILIPWVILSAVSGDYRTAIGLGIVYVIITVIRNIMEPKIIGEHVGLHPIVTLLAMVVGVYVFGGIGLLGLPLFLALCQSLNEAGVIHWFKKVPPEAPEPPKSAKPEPSEAASGGSSETH